MSFIKRINYRLQRESSSSQNFLKVSNKFPSENKTRINKVLHSKIVLPCSYGSDKPKG